MASFNVSILFKTPPLDSTESDHRIAKAVGGQGVLENGLLVHPICNRMKSDLSLEEIRADLFGELLY